MRVVVDFQDEDLEFEVPSERVVATWRGPEGLGPEEAVAAVRDALENPRDFPPLRQMIVPGDRVAIALDPSIPRSRSVLDGLVEVLLQAGAGEESLAIVTPMAAGDAGHRTAGDGAGVVHDPDDRARIAYLASTKEGRRIYLNRAITDADVVLPVGRLGFDPDLGFRGPWSILFPGLSDRKTMRELRDRNGGGTGEGGIHRSQARLDESFEVSWLLGTQFYLGVVPGRIGPLEVIAGRDAAVREGGIASLEQNWTFSAPSRAEMVIAGVGSPGAIATLEDLAGALETATRLVQHGGKIVVVSRVAGTIGPALQRMKGADDPREAAAALRGHEDDEDYPIARRIARASAWADLFVASALDPEVLEDLSIVPLEHPEQARRLAASSGSLAFVGQAELTRAIVLDEQ
jgi:nickel-dependent lactate racemase